MDTGHTSRVRRFSPRSSTLARALTISLLMLAASPFSAPFCTFDVAQAGHAMPADETKIKTSLDDTPIGVSTFDMMAASWTLVVSRPSGRVNLISAHCSRHSVLRL